jgi:hypothetical protein
LFCFYSSSGFSPVSDAKVWGDSENKLKFGIYFVISDTGAAGSRRQRAPAYIK